MIQDGTQQHSFLLLVCNVSDAPGKLGVFGSVWSERGRRTSSFPMTRLSRSKAKIYKEPPTVWRSWKNIPADKQAWCIYGILKAPLACVNMYFLPPAKGNPTAPWIRATVLRRRLLWNVSPGGIRRRRVGGDAEGERNLREAGATKPGEEGKVGEKKKSQSFRLCLLGVSRVILKEIKLDWKWGKAEQSSQWMEAA